MSESTTSAIEREKKRLPFGWGRFGKALDRLAELLEPGEVLELATVGVYKDYRDQHVFGRYGAGLTNFLVGVTDRRLFVIATSLKGSPLDHDAHHAVEWADLTEFTVDSEKKRSVVVSFPAGTVPIEGIAKSAFADFVTAVGAHTDVRTIS